MKLLINPEAEQSILGALLLDNSYSDEVFSILSDKDFAGNSHKKIFLAMMSLWSQRKPIDMITLPDLLESEKILDLIGGVPYLAELSTVVPSSTQSIEYAMIVKEYSQKRKILEISKTMQKMTNDNYDPFEIISFCDKEFSEISKPKKIITLSEVSKRAFDEICSIMDNEKKIKVQTGFTKFDDATGGLQQGALYVIAARPGVGKTSFALNLAKNISIHTPIVFFSLEMNENELAFRLLSKESGISHSKISNGAIDESNWKMLENGLERLKSDKFIIDDTSRITISELRGNIHKIVREKKIQVVFIDYLQLISSNGKHQNRVSEITEISRELKIIAGEMKVVIVALSQMSRDSEKRSDKLPMLSDLRDSGSIEQDANFCAFIHEDSVGHSLIIRKNRSGKCMDIPLHFDKRTQTFTEAP